MNEEEYNKYHEFFADYWTWFKKYKSPPPDNAKESRSYWSSVDKEAVKLAEKYDNSRFVKDIILVTRKEFERLSNE